MFEILSFIALILALATPCLVELWTAQHSEPEDEPAIGDD